MQLRILLILVRMGTKVMYGDERVELKFGQGNMNMCNMASKDERVTQVTEENGDRWRIDGTAVFILGFKGHNVKKLFGLRPELPLSTLYHQDLL